MAYEWNDGPRDGGAMTPATMKALRTTVGLSVEAFAAEVGVAPRSVSRWENGKNPIPQEVADVLLSWLGRYESAVAQALGAMDDVIGRAGRPPALVPITYYRSQADYDEHGRDPGYVGFVNAVARRVAEVLRSRRIEVEFRYQDQGAVRCPGSNY